MTTPTIVYVVANWVPYEGHSKPEAAFYDPAEAEAERARLQKKWSAHDYDEWCVYELTVGKPSDYPS